MNVVSLKCANCGANLRIGPDVEHFACSYCGAQQVVQRSGGIVSLRRIETTLREVKQGTDRTASELALQRLLAEVAAIQSERDTAIQQIHQRSDASNGAIGVALIIGAIAAAWAILRYGWWAVPVVIIVGYLAYKAIPTVSGQIADIRRQADARIGPLQQQIAHHRAIVGATQNTN